MKYRCVVSDLDRTILRRDGISHRTKEVLEKLADSHVIFIPASGRSVYSIPECIREIRGIRYAITSNGAAIYDLSDDHSVYNLKLRPEVPEQIFDLVTDKDVFFECFIDGRGYTSEIYYENPMNFGESEDISAYVRSTRTPVPDIRQFILQHNTELDSISIVGPTEKKYRIMHELTQNIHTVYVTFGAPRLIEISDRHSGKHNGLKEVLRFLGISMEETIAFGDGDNDSEMLAEAGLGVAVLNATERCKEAADLVIGDYLDDSVADFLEKTVL